MRCLLTRVIATKESTVARSCRQGESVERQTHPTPGNEITQEHPVLVECYDEWGGEEWLGMG